MLPNRLIIDNGPAETIFTSPVLAGTALEFALYFEDETAPGSGVYAPFVLATGSSFVCGVRLAPSDSAECGTMTCTAVSGSPGWYQFFMPASDSLNIGHRDVYWAVKYVPASPNENHSRLIAYGTIPVRYGAVR